MLGVHTCLHVIRRRTSRGPRMAGIGGGSKWRGGVEDDAAHRVTDTAAVLYAMSEKAAACVCVQGPRSAGLRGEGREASV